MERKNKGADCFAVTAKLICVFVFAYSKRRFSHDAAHIWTVLSINLNCISNEIEVDLKIYYHYTICIVVQKKVDFDFF